MSTDGGRTPASPIITQPARRDVGSRDVLKGHPGDPPKAEPIDKPSVSGYGDPQTVERIISKLCRELMPGAGDIDSFVTGVKAELVRLKEKSERLIEERPVLSNGAAVEFLCREFAVYLPGGMRHIDMTLVDVVRVLKERLDRTSGVEPRPSSAPHRNLPTKQRVTSFRMDATIDAALKDAPLDAPAAVEILEVCLDLAVFLMRKNAAYGNSALQPLRIMSKANAEEQIRVRMDDKLNRMVQGKTDSEDPAQDFVGYWVLLRVLKLLAQQPAEQPESSNTEAPVERPGNGVNHG